MIHVLASLALSTQIYYMGRFKIGECCDRTISSWVCRCLLSPPACAAQSYGPSSDLPCPLIPLMLSWPLKSLCCCFLEQWESAGAVCSVVQDCWALGELPFSCSSPWCCAQRGHLHPVLGKRVCWGAWLLCSAYKPISSSSSVSASDGPDSGNCPQLSFFPVELIVLSCSSQGLHGCVWGGRIVCHLGSALGK